MKGLIIFLFIVSGFLGYAQNIHFIKTYGNSGYDYGRDVKQTLDTGYIATGSSSSFSTGTADAFLLKVDSLGDFKWSYSYGGLGSDWGEKVILTKDSAYALTGYTNSFGAGGFDFYLVKTDINGNPEWEKTYGGGDWDKAFSFVQMPDSGYVMVGETYSFGAGNKDGYIVRVDKLGDTLWTKTYGGVEDDFFKDVVFDGDSLLVVGTTYSYGSGGSDGLIIKLGIDGDIGWTEYVGQMGDDSFNSILHRDTFYIAGGARSYAHFGACDCAEDFWIYKFTWHNELVLADTTWYGEQVGVDVVNDIVLNPNNDMFYGGRTTSWGAVDITSGYSDAFIGRLLNNYYTAFDYINNFGEQKDDEVFGLDYCYDNGVVGVGHMNFGSTGGYNMFIVKVDRLNSWPSIDVATDLSDEIITLKTESNASIEQLRIYPTLASSTIQVSGLLASANYKIYSVTGSLMQSGQVSNEIGVEQLPKGYFILSIQTEKGIEVFKFFKD